MKYIFVDDYRIKFADDAERQISERVFPEAILIVVPLGKLTAPVRISRVPALLKLTPMAVVPGPADLVNVPVFVKVGIVPKPPQVMLLSP